MSQFVSRREVLGLLGAAATPVWGAAFSLGAEKSRPPAPLGVCKDSYQIAWGAARGNRPEAPFHDATGFLEYCHRLGAGGIQVGLGAPSSEDAARLREKAEAFGMFVEGQVGLPRTPADVSRFEAEVRAARQAGAEVVRGAAPGSRRYEAFDSADAFRRAVAEARECLALAEPVLTKHRVRLALENHKDWRVGELLEVLRRLGSSQVGICVDTGNSIALMEDPMSVVEAYAPWAVTVHLKDMAVAEYEGGFLLSEVPLGEGFLDLSKMVAALRRAAPKIRFTLEMITRDPLQVPCLSAKYWATMEDVPASRFAHALARIRAQAAKKPLPRVAGLSLPEKLQAEDRNVRKSLAYARQHLGL